MDNFSLFAHPHPLLTPVSSLRLDRDLGDTHYIQQVQRNKPPPVTMVSDQPIPNFAQLKTSTDLNVPPPNWLQSQSWLPQDGRQLSHTRGQPAELASSGICSVFTGEADFVAPVDNMKTIFKIPYSKSKVSMAVHRVGNTLFLDGSLDDTVHDVSHTAEDTHKLSSQVHDDDDMVDAASHFHTPHSSPNTLSAPHVEQQADDTSSSFQHTPNTASTSNAQTPPPPPSLASKSISSKKKNQTKSLENALYSKFLYHSVKPSEPSHVEEGNSSIPRPPKQFLRVGYWDFMDMKMLLGSDLLQVSNPEHPCVSLRLYDADRAITAMTWLDFWLDNVMNNVPELAVCYHKKGIVQSYQLTPTCDIPLKKNFVDEPNAIEANGLCLLNWLQANCSREAGTYWLFKEQGDAELQLFDLTALYEFDGAPAEFSKKSNPFSYPVAMLCFRIARGMPYDRMRVRNLLEKCVELLGDMNPVVSAISHELIADTYLSIDSKSPFRASSLLTSQCAESLSSIDIDDYLFACEHLSASIKMLHKHSTGTASLPRLQLKAAECYYIVAVLHNAQGHFGRCLRALEVAARFINWDTVPTETVPRSEDNLTMEEHESLLAARLLQFSGDFFYELPSLLTIESLDECNAFLSSHSLPQQTEPIVPVVVYEHSRRPSINACDVTESDSEEASRSPFFLPYPLVLDRCTNYTLALQQYRNSWNFISSKSIADLSRIKSEQIESNAPHFDIRLPELVLLLKKLGNVANEVGKMSLSVGQCDSAFEYFTQGLAAFHLVDDYQNQALLRCNLGHVMHTLANKYCASIVDPTAVAQATVVCDPNHELSEEQRLGRLSDLAIKHHQAAASVLPSRKTEPGLWDRMQCELAATYLTVALRFQQRTPENVTPEALEEARNELLKNAYTLIDVYGTDAMRAAVCFHWGVHFKDSCLRVQHLPNGRRFSKPKHQQAFQHLQRAGLLFLPTDTAHRVQVHLQLAELEEQFIYGTRLKSLESALHELCSITRECNQPLEEDTDVPQPDVPSPSSLLSLLCLVLERLQTVLKGLVKVTMEQKLVRKSEAYKNFYREALAATPYSVLTLLRRIVSVEGSL